MIFFSESDRRRNLTRAKGDVRFFDLTKLDHKTIITGLLGCRQAWKNNVVIVDKIVALAQKKNVTPAQFCIAWVSSLGPHVIPLPGSS